MIELIKSKERVQSFGEVFTPIFIVKKMLRVVEDEIKNPETKFLEPSAGEGAFLCELLRQRLNFFKDRDEKFLLKLLANIYGIELLSENISVAREEMKKICREFIFDEEILQTADFVIEKNIVCADALDLKNILFGDWQFFPTVRTIFKFVKNIQQNLFEEENFMDEKKSSLVILGNPPYQKDNENIDGTRDNPIYHKFLEESWKIADKVIMIHPARCLFNAGATPKDFNKKILNDEHIKVVDYEPDCRKIFPNTDIKGGVAITYFDKEKNFGAIKHFIPFPELNSIHKKVVLENKNFQPFSKLFHTPVAYRFSKKFFEERPDLITKLQKADDSALRTNIFERLPEIFFDEKPDDGEYIQILGRQANKRVFKWILRRYIIDEDLIDKFKIFMNEANGTGAFGEILTMPFMVGRNIGSTQTFISIGGFEAQEEARACLAYIKTKFCRAMLGILKVTQHNPPQTWAKVPLQDFSASSDIDWSKKISEIDGQLYEKYSLSAEEIKFIEEKVKEMN